MRTLPLFVFSLAAFSSAFAANSAPAPATAAAPASPIVFPNYGFSINPLEVGTVYPVVPAIQMYLPAMPLPSNPNLTFSPNVFVQVQPFVGTMKDYINQSMQSMQDAGYIIRGQIMPSTDEWSLEYIGVANGVAMHWYAKAVRSGYRIYYAAGGVPDELWPTLADALKSCVNSFKITGTAPEIKFTPTPAPVTAPPVGGPATAITTPAAKSSVAPAAKSTAGTSTSK